jgi:hypothetical protein
MECPKCNGLNSMDAKFCTSCGASIKEPPEEDPFDLSTWKGRIRFAGGLVVLVAFVIVGVGVFWYAISSWGWIWGIVGGIIIILLCILFKRVP